MKLTYIIRGHTFGFTLVEVVVAVGITASTLTILIGLMSILTRDVRQLRPYEAWRRPAFQAESKSSSNSTTTPDTYKPKVNDTLPDERLEPALRPDENLPPVDPDDPNADPNKPATATPPPSNP